VTGARKNITTELHGVYTEYHGVLIRKLHPSVKLRDLRGKNSSKVEKRGVSEVMA